MLETAGRNWHLGRTGTWVALAPGVATGHIASTLHRSIKVDRVYWLAE